jgi:hypothetical protein
VNVAVYPVIYVSNEVLNFLIRIVDRRGLDLAYINRNRNIISDGLLDWLSTRHLQKVILEIYDDSGRVVERFDLCFEYSSVVPSSSDSVFETNLRKLENFLDGLPNLHSKLAYRIVAILSPGAPEVPGWSPTKLRSVDHLKKKRLGGIIKADYIGVAMEYWG